MQDYRKTRPKLRTGDTIKVWAPRGESDVHTRRSAGRQRKSNGADSRPFFGVGEKRGIGMMEIWQRKHLLRGRGRVKSWVLRLCNSSKGKNSKKQNGRPFWNFENWGGGGLRGEKYEVRSLKGMSVVGPYKNQKGDKRRAGAAIRFKKATKEDESL